MLNWLMNRLRPVKWLRLQESKPMYFISANLGEPINDRFEESNPVVSGDESVIVFTRKLQFYDAVFCSRKAKRKME